MIASALLVLAERPFVERQLGTLFCAQRAPSLREQCLRSWRRCGC